MVVFGDGHWPWLQGDFQSEWVFAYTLELERTSRFSLLHQLGKELWSVPNMGSVHPNQPTPNNGNKSWSPYSFPALSVAMRLVYSKLPFSATWVAQSVKLLTFDFGSGHDLMVCDFEPHIGLWTGSTEPARESLSPSPSAPPLLTKNLSLSKINK